MINKDKGICGGEAILGRTRIPVWSILFYLNKGASEEWLLTNYPSLSEEMLSIAKEYYLNNKEEIDRLISEDIKAFTEETESTN
jgi:uncharacterized protein (DUF433 family)